jgi:tetratricopeptide (TPR) repeat protein
MTPQQKAYLEVLAYVFLQHAKYDKALVIYQVLQSLYPQSADYPLALAYLYIQLQDYLKADEQAQLAIAIGLPFFKLYFCRLLRSKALWNLGHEALSQQLLLEFLEMKKQTLNDSTSNIGAIGHFA